MARPATSDLSTLFAFINIQVAGAGVFGDGLRYRDLQNYYLAKKNDASNDRADVKEMAKAALRACGLDETHVAVSTLNNPGQEKARAAAAAVLAMSIIKNTTEENLGNHYERLRKAGVDTAIKELRQLLTHGDVEVSQSNPRISLKNFTSAGLQGRRYKLDAVEALERSNTLVVSARRDFITNGSAALPDRVAAAFQLYFGAPAAMVATAALQWKPASANVQPPAFGALQVSHRTVVREVVARLCNVYLANKNFRIYFGGQSIDDGTKAYVSGAIDPTKIHVAQGFFSQGKTGTRTQAGTLVHEMTHTWARTRDHAYGTANCQGLVAANVGQALSNADNYRFFFEKAYG